jgi:micrococcal nuclease
LQSVLLQSIQFKIQSSTAMRLFHLLVLPLALLQLPIIESSKTPRKFVGKVVKIIDGDTIDAVYKDSTYRIRLCGIDAPEYGQDFYAEAKDALSKLVCKQDVIIDYNGEDIHGRTLGVIYRNADSLNINREMVREGMAWNYVDYSIDKELPKLESEAREKHVGLWSLFHYLEPWEYRKGH